MALTKSELISSLQNEVRILVHLASKIDHHQLDYRPTSKQRSTIDLLRYLNVMGPALVQGTIAGAFDGAAWGVAQQAAEARTFDQVVASIATQSEFYASAIGHMHEADFRTEIEMFGNTTTKGAFLVNMVLCGHAAYRTQLFNYLKACGREELGTANLWRGVDAPPPD